MQGILGGNLLIGTHAIEGRDRRLKGLEIEKVQREGQPLQEALGRILIH